MSSKLNEKHWQNYLSKIVLNSASHPIEYAKVLIQIGYEPLPPRAGTTFFGKKTLKLPNIFEYIKYIKNQDGFTGCYRGLVPKLCGNVVCAVVCYKILDRLEKKPENVNEETESENLTEYEKFIVNIKKNIITRLAAVIVSHPFHVVTVRMMAQFVGKETKYDGTLCSFLEIYKENGIFGLFHGIVPRMIGEILSILLANSLSFFVSSYIIEEEDLKLYSCATMSFLASALTYPFQVVTNCMVVNNSGLMAGSPPYMPIYTTWLDCWENLSEGNQLKRGSSLLMRFYTGPQMISDGKLFPVTKNQLNSK